MTDFSSFCDSCGKPVVWAEHSPGQRVPLDPRPPVFHVTADSAARTGFSAIRLPNAMVSHFATCLGAPLIAKDSAVTRP